VTSPLTRTLRAYAADARAAFSAAPVEVALGVLLAVALSVEVRSKGFTENELARLAASVALAFPLVFALSVLRARGVVSAAARWAGTVAILAGCAAFGALALHDDRQAEWWRWALLAVAAVLLLVLTAALPRGERERRREWAFAWRGVVRVVGIGLYSVALFGMLAGAVAAVVSLFDLSKPDHLYTDLAGAVFFAFAPWIFVGGIHRLFAPAEAGVPEAVSRMGRWLYAPVLVVYLLILYAYAARVLVTGELPRNLVSPLVIAAGLIGMIGAVLLEPVHADEEHRGLSMLVRAVPALLLPLVPLAAWALLARLGEYGWTEFRYARLAAVLAIGILAVLGTVRLIRRRPPLLSTVPAVFAAVLLLSALGPWSAPAVSRRDQTSRLRAALAEARIDPRRLPREPVTVDGKAFDRISSGARYLADSHGVGALREVFPNLPDSTRGVWRMGEQLGIRPGCRATDPGYVFLRWGAGVSGVMGGTMTHVEPKEGIPLAVDVGGARLTLRLAGDSVYAVAAGWSGAADAGVLRRRIAAAAGCDDEPAVRGRVAPAGEDPQALPAAEALLTLRDAAGTARAQLLVQSATGGPPPSSAAPAPRAPAPPAPGMRLREVQGWLIVP
jgi:cytochrome bd-type quinol oxidase subunit 2